MIIDAQYFISNISKWVADKNFRNNSNTMVKQLLGIIVVAVHNNMIDQKVVEEFFELTSKHEIDVERLRRSLWRKQGIFTKDFIHPDLYNNKLYQAIEEELFDIKPGKAQSGPGEAFLVLFSKTGHYVGDAKAGYDVIIAGVTIELKSQGTQKTGEIEKLEIYKKNGKVQLFMVVKRPTKTAPPMFVFADFENGDCWRDIVRFTGKDGKKLYSDVLSNHVDIFKARKEFLYAA